MEKINELTEALYSSRPNGWDKFPDIELYKDQLLSYMQRQYIPSAEDDPVTGAMINNYIKAGALPRPNGKKYGKEHIALLTAICALKPVLSVSDIEYILKKQQEELGAEQFYTLMLEKMDLALSDTAAGLESGLEEDALAEFVLSAALRAAGLRIACTRLLMLMREKDEETAKKAKNGAKKEQKENQPEN